MSIINLPFTFTAGATIIAAQFNSNFQTIYNDYNGNITNANLSSSSTFPDSVLQQIQTSGKVNGSALTLLTNIPSGAGLVPTANLGSGAANSTTFLRGDQTWALPTQAYIKCTNTQAQNTGGGTATSGAWAVIPLTMKDSDTQNIGTFTTNQLTIPAGTYKVSSSCPFFFTNQAQARLFNLTGTAVLLIGSSTVASSAGASIQTYSFIVGQFTLAVSSAIELQYQTSSTEASVGLGNPSNFGTEVFAILELSKVG